MRPIRLSVSAFAAYADRLELDFRDLGDHSLFLVHGPTGAGKTTVLDAMCFALYGERSGEDRDVKRVRSDHADPDTPTEVTFEFSLAGASYRVFRRPEQPRPKKRGGFTTGRPEASLWKIKGNCASAADDVLLADRWTTVTAEVEALLGFRSDQFRQVVMLPQGEFRRLLMADSRQRQEILEALFRTQLYRRIEEALKLAAREVKTGITEASNHLKFVLGQAEAESPEKLGEMRLEAEQGLIRVREDLQRIKKVEIEAQDRLNEARRAADRLRELNAAEVAAKVLKEKVAEFGELRETLARARLAGTIIPEEKAMAARSGEAEEADLALKKAREESRRALENKDLADAALEKELNRGPERDEARRRLDRLENLGAKVAELDATRKRLDTADKEYRKRSAREAAARTALEKLELKGKEDREALAVAVKSAERTEFLVLKLREEERGAQQIKKLEELRKKDALQNKDLEALRAEISSVSGRLQEAIAERKALESAWIEGQAAILAERLSPGQPCPVCGSRDHPAPARSAASLPDDDALKLRAQREERLSQELEALKGRSLELEKTAAAIRAEVRILEEELGDSAIKPARASQEAVRTLKRELEETREAERQVRALKHGLERLEQDQARLAGEKTGSEEQRQSAEQSWREAAAEVTAREADIPEELRKPGALQRARESAQTNLTALDRALEAAREATNRSNEALTAARAAEEAAQNSAAMAASRLMTQREEFEKRLKEAGFQDQQEFAAARRTPAEIDRLQSRIEEFEQRLTAAEDRRKRALEAAKDLKQPDMEALTEQADKAKADLEKGLQEEANRSSTLERLTGWVSEASRLSGLVAALEEEYAIKGRIADVANGGNSEGITFQRFVLAALLDDVLLAASNRLRMMSGNRFQLQRVRERTDRRIAGGLDLEAYDEYTGTARPVSTLSGGESFLASLSLALGLADVVQSYSGGVQLDAVFVDEGFGSLDPEALDLAMKALIDLQRQGRLVGVISHVPGLREMIDARLEVSRTRSGSDARFLIGRERDT